MRIAVVGAGVSGLVAAHLLAPEHEVHVFEAQAYAGGHTNTVRVDTPNETHWVDTGFIVFNDRNYPRFERLLQRLGVAGQPSDMSFAVSDARGDFEYASTSAERPVRQARAPRHAVVPPHARRPACASSARRARCSRAAARARRSATSSRSAATRARSSTA